MPMFREDDMGPRSSRDSDSQYPDSAPIPIQTPPGMRWLSHRLSEESIRTELCEGPLPDTPPKPATPEEAVSRAVSDRAELIERLKRGESPTWIPNRHLESLFHQSKASSPPRTPRPTASASPGSLLLPAPIITPDKQDAAQVIQQGIDSPLRAGLSIERPRSALHSGNFTPVELSPRADASGDAILPDSENHFRPGPGWMGTSPPADYTPFNLTQDTASYRREAFKSGPSSLSSSLSSSFAYQPPTSPLVQSESNEELDLTLPLDRFNIDANSPRNPRRHTLNFCHSPFANAANRRQSPIRRESTYPYQAHQPRRSVHATPSFSLPGTSPQAPGLFPSRRPSFGSEASPLHHASMVGSYEESILRGRMSTTPSKPLEFTSQIGVLGLGKCKASLRCPAHVTLPFSAVFYNYASTASGGSKMEDGPSPYVGQIDLENGLPNSEEGQRAKRKQQSRYQGLKGVGEGIPAHDIPVDVSESEGASRATKPKRPSRTPKAPPGGGYRIPEKGQLQIIIKNQNKTAVKLFLIPYDLAGMEPGTKTFIRQRSYSAGPMIETEVATTKDAPTTGPDRPTLRYLVHLHICCPSKGRFYLYKSIRVVFANRVPDGKERLRNEVTCPDPRFTPYKPVRAMHPPGHLGSAISTISPGAALAVERASRRRSAGFTLGQQHPSRHHHPFHVPEVPPHHYRIPQPIPQTALPTATHGTNPAKQDITATTTTAMAMPGIEMTGRSTTTTTTATNPNTNPNTTPNQPTTTTYDKLSKGDAGYGGGSHPNNNSSSSSSSTHPNAPPLPATEGLLSKRLRSLGVVQHLPNPPPPPLMQQAPPPPPQTQTQTQPGGPKEQEQ